MLPHYSIRLTASGICSMWQNQWILCICNHCHTSLAGHRIPWSRDYAGSHVGTSLCEPLFSGSSWDSMGKKDTWNTCWYQNKLLPLSKQKTYNTDNVPSSSWLDSLNNTWPWSLLLNVFGQWESKLLDPYISNSYSLHEPIVPAMGWPLTKNGWYQVVGWCLLCGGVW